MLNIINNKKGVQISIDDKHHAVTIIPKPYEEDYPSIMIELKDIDFQRHAIKCPDCKKLNEDFGTPNTGWFLIWNDKKYRLDLSRLGFGRDKNLISWQVGYYFTGTKLKFLISTESVNSLEAELDSSLEIENFEHCAFLRDRIKELKEE
jgi:hypothetical protein